MPWFLAVCMLVLLSTGLCEEVNDGVPSLRVKTKSSVFEIGERRGIHCEGYNLPEPSEWYNPNGEKVKSRSKDHRINTERKNGDAVITLIIHVMQVEDSGNWTCRAGDLSDYINIVVGEKVKLPKGHEEVEGEENRSIRLDCQAKGIPAPVVQWYKDSTLIVADGKKYNLRKQENNHQLEIKRLTHMDAGEYVCKITQETLSHFTEKIVQLTVQHKPILIDSFTQEVVTYKSEEVYAVIGEVKNITCSAIANPPPQYRWNKVRGDYDMDEIKDPEMVKTSEDGLTSVLILRMYDESYEGQYKCSAKNAKGQDHIIFHVRRGDKPPPPTNISLVFANSTDLTFNLTCETCIMEVEEGVPEDPKALKVLGYTIMVVPAQENLPAAWDEGIDFQFEIQDPLDTIFSVGSLQNTTTYHVRVRTYNRAGYSDWWELEETFSTTDHAFRTISSALLIITTLLCIYYI